MATLRIQGFLDYNADWAPRPDGSRPDSPGTFLRSAIRGRLSGDAFGVISECPCPEGSGRQRTGIQILGASAVRGQHPVDRPKKSKKSPAPLFHTASQAVRRELYEMQDGSSPLSARNLFPVATERLVERTTKGS